MKTPRALPNQTAPPPSPEGPETTEVLLLRCQALLGRHLHRYWHRVTQAAGAVGDLFVTLGEATQALGRASTPPADLGERAEFEAAVARSRAQPAPTLDALGAAFALNPEATELLGVLAALQSSAELLRLATFAWADFAQKQPTVDFIVTLCADDPAHRSRLLEALAPNQPLRSHALFKLHAARRWSAPGPLASRPIVASDAVWRALQGQLPVSEDRPVTMAGPTVGLAPEEIVAPNLRLQAAIRRAMAGGEPVLVVGQAGGGRRTRVASAAGLGCWQVDDDARLLAGAPEAALVAALRDARLAGAPLAIVRVDRPRQADQWAAVAQAVRHAASPVVLLTTSEQAAPLVAALPQAHIVEQHPPDGLARARLYARLLARHGQAAEARDIAALAETHAVPPQAIDRALHALAQEGGGAFEPAALDGVLRRRTRTRLGDLAQRLRTLHTWADLVLTDAQRTVVDEIIAHAQHRARVFQEWGFGRTTGGRGRGLACLFSGPPGTGKSMTAALIGEKLGLDVYQVDLARVVDKYVGETEKNLGRLFDEASRVPVILLFDEADALFAARTGINSANDRYANLEVNFLLQRMEAFDGISILTTNKGTALDPAFKRRLRFRLHFDLPDVGERRRLWSQMVPPGCLVADDIEWQVFAERWEISGAVIRNAMLRAAFLAAARDAPLDAAMLTEATRAELFELGRLPG
jgi:hypothetical protein